MDDDRKLRWAAHCHRMAEATHAIADWCEDRQMMAAYLELAARWIRLAEHAPPDVRRRRAA